MKLLSSQPQGLIATACALTASLGAAFAQTAPIVVNATGTDDVNVNLRSGDILINVDLPNIDWLGRGYDILRGNPHPTGRDGQSGMDPGFRHPIFRVEYSTEDYVSFTDKTFKVPDYIEAYSCASCSFDFSSSDTMNSAQYKLSLRSKVAASYSGGGQAWSASFKASADFRYAEERQSKARTYVIESGGECNVYCADYAPYSYPRVRDAFLRAVDNELTVEYDETKYFKFIEKYGTHFATGLRLGASYGVSYELSAESAEKLTEAGMDLKFAASASAFGHAGSGSFESQMQAEAATAFSQETASETEFSIGGTPVAPENGSKDTTAWFEKAAKNPLPTSYKLSQISELFTEEVFPSVANITEKRANIENALDRYCSILQGKGEIVCNELAQFSAPLVDVRYSEMAASQQKMRISASDPNVFTETGWTVRSDCDTIITRDSHFSDNPDFLTSGDPWIGIHGSGADGKCTISHEVSLPSDVIYAWAELEVCQTNNVACRVFGYHDGNEVIGPLNHKACAKKHFLVEDGSVITLGEYGLSCVIGVRRFRITEEAPHIFNGAEGGAMAYDGCPSNESQGHVADQCLSKTDELAATRCCGDFDNICDSVCKYEEEKVSFLEAEVRCSLQGLRMCTKAELSDNRCCGTGCNFDHLPVWTAETCGTRVVSS